MARPRARPARSASAFPGNPVVGLLDRAPDVVFRVRLAPRPRVEYVNRAVLAVSGYSPEEWYADPSLPFRTLTPPDRRRLQEIFRTRRLPQQPFVLRSIRRDGTAVRVEISAIPVYGRQGAVVAMEGIARDVTTSRGESGPRHTPDRFARTVFEQAPIGVAHIGGDGRFLHVNRRLCEITGYSADELLAKHFHDVTPAQDVDRDVALLQQLRANDRAIATIEKRCACKDGSTIWVKVIASRLRNAGSLDSIAVIDRIPEPAAQEAEQGRLAYAGIEVDADRLEVTWSGRRVNLTLKEVLLLRYLIRHRGEMLARDRLLRDVWGYEHTGRSRTLDVHICRLRRKLPPLADSLVTIGHFGYTLSEEVGVSQVVSTT